ncbi:hypothetical protein POCGH01_00025100 [Plasmodium ovale]|uniref:Uncharacterized protein n=2 Tax=Plasmodium ovale TaxID=36330 RepID=A0A1A8WRR2_PLAOA|nr:hypothetical protein POVCU2_0085420 [Plasmodium ovale curtisi]SBT00099.1 hypothetical protein POVCU1_057580 [Plasmodium ovale curtisi]SBT83350.1 hypothetical protein POCGH01_00025100 [Plasmodium ovale]
MTFFQNDFNKNSCKKIDLNRPLGLRTARLLLQESSLEYERQNGRLKENAVHKRVNPLLCMDCFDPVKKKLQEIYSYIESDLLWSSSTNMDKNMEKSLNTKSSDNKNLCEEVTKFAFLMMPLYMIGVMGTAPFYLLWKANRKLKKNKK